MFRRVRETTVGAQQMSYQDALLAFTFCKLFFYSIHVDLASVAHQVLNKEGGGQRAAWRKTWCLPFGRPVYQREDVGKSRLASGCSCRTEGTEYTPGPGSLLLLFSYVSWQVTVVLGLPFCAVG